MKWFGEFKYDGVFGLWYGKGIGVDCVCELMKLGNLEGVFVIGGFVIVVGDDYGGKFFDSVY